MKSQKRLISEKRPVSESSITCLPPTHNKTPWKRQTCILCTKYLSTQIGALHENRTHHWHPYSKFVKWNMPDDFEKRTRMMT